MCSSSSRAERRDDYIIRARDPCAVRKRKKRIVADFAHPYVSPGQPDVHVKCFFTLPFETTLAAIPAIAINYFPGAQPSKEGIILLVNDEEDRNPVKKHRVPSHRSKGRSGHRPPLPRVDDLSRQSFRSCEIYQQWNQRSVKRRPEGPERECPRTCRRNQANYSRGKKACQLNFLLISFLPFFTIPGSTIRSHHFSVLLPYHLLCTYIIRSRE